MNKQNIKFIGLFILLLLAVAVIALPTSARPALGVTNFDSIWLSDSGPTAQPVLRVNQKGTGKIVEFMDNGTPVWSVLDGGAVNGKTWKNPTTGQTQYCNLATVTASVSYTSTVTAISTPTSGVCTLTAITGDANKCSVINGTGIFTISVVNSALTPAAASGAAGVNFCLQGN